MEAVYSKNQEVFELAALRWRETKKTAFTDETIQSLIDKSRKFRELNRVKSPWEDV